jgi:N-methylhydantoinase B
MRREKMAKDEVFENMSAGGGGWGNPLARDLDLIMDDVQNLKVSTESARDVYGVEILSATEVRETAQRLEFQAKSAKNK